MAGLENSMLPSVKFILKVI